MNNLSLIISIVAGLVIVVSVWMIVYFGSRILIDRYEKKHLGDMPSSEELHELYEKNNSIIRYDDHSPTRKNL